MAREIGPAGGELTNPAGASVSLPPNAVDEFVMASILPVPDPQLPVTPGVELIPGTGFDVSLATVTGAPVGRLREPATLRLALSPEQWRNTAAIYWIHDGRVERVASSTLERDGVSATLAHFSRFAVGVPVPAEAASRSLWPWIAAVLGVLTVLVVGSFAAGILGRRRSRALMTRRQVRRRQGWR